MDLGLELWNRFLEDLFNRTGNFLVFLHGALLDQGLFEPSVRYDGCLHHQERGIIIIVFKEDRPKIIRIKSPLFKGFPEV